MGKKFKIIFTLFLILIAIVLINTIFFIRSKNKKTFTDKYCDCSNLNRKCLNNSNLINWTVTLLIKTNYTAIDYRPFCLGIVLNEKIILTSATCFISSQTNLSNIFITDNLNQIKSNYKKIYFHPKFNSSNEFGSFYDLALIKLETEFEFAHKSNQSKIRPACLIDKKLDYFNNNKFMLPNFSNRKLPINKIELRNNLTDYKFTITIVNKIDCFNLLNKLINEKLINLSFAEQFKLSSICLKNSKNLNPINNIYTSVLYKYDRKFFVIGFINNYLSKQFRKDDCLNNSIGFFTLFNDQHLDWIQQLIGDKMCTDLDKINQKEFNHFILLTGASYFLVSCLILYFLTIYVPSKKILPDNDSNYLNSDLKNLDDNPNNLNTDNGKFNLSGKSLIKSKKSNINNHLNNIQIKTIINNKKDAKLNDIELKELKNQSLNKDELNNNEINNKQQLNKDRSIDNRKN